MVGSDQSGALQSRFRSRYLPNCWAARGPMEESQSPGLGDGLGAFRIGGGHGVGLFLSSMRFSPNLGELRDFSATAGWVCLLVERLVDLS